jgi:hypothetical protein
MVSKGNIEEVPMPNLEQLIKWAPVASLIAFGAGLCFEDGYFSGMDINMYTFFSLSEHVLFSIEAIPMVLVPSLAGSLTGTVLILGQQGLLDSVAPGDGRGKRLGHTFLSFTVPVISMAAC